MHSHAAKKCLLTDYPGRHLVGIPALGRGGSISATAGVGFLAVVDLNAHLAKAHALVPLARYEVLVGHTGNGLARLLGTTGFEN